MNNLLFSYIHNFHVYINFISLFIFFFSIFEFFLLLLLLFSSSFSHHTDRPGREYGLALTRDGADGLLGMNIHSFTDI